MSHHPTNLSFSKTGLNPLKPKQTINVVGHFRQRSSNQPDKITTLKKPNKIAFLVHETRNKKNTTTDVLKLMDSLNFRVTPEIYSSLIKECTTTRDCSDALELHNHIILSDIEPSSSMMNRLLLMHISCGRLDTACDVFDEMPMWMDANSWGIIIVGLAKNGEYEKAVNVFGAMLFGLSRGLEFPTHVVLCVLEACLYTSNSRFGKQVYGMLVKLGGVDHAVDDQLIRCNAAVWTSKIVSDCKEGRFDEVMKVFNHMGRARIRRNSLAFSSVLRACTRIDGKDGPACGRQVHALAVKLGLELNGFVQCGLIGMYGKCGLVGEAKRVFESINHKGDAACWNAMLTSYTRNGSYFEALKLLYRMRAAGLEIQRSLINQVRIGCGDKIIKV